MPPTVGGARFPPRRIPRTYITAALLPSIARYLAADAGEPDPIDGEMRHLGDLVGSVLMLLALDPPDLPPCPCDGGYYGPEGRFPD